MKILAAALTCLFLLMNQALAQSGAHMRFTRPPNLVSEDPSIVSMMQDRQGFVWIGYLNGGLSRYDGGRTVHFTNDPARADSLPAGRVNTLMEDGKGRIWAGTATGLALFNPETSGFTRYVSSPKPGRHQVIRRIIADGKGGMWVGTWSGLQHFDPATGKFTLYVSREGQADDIASNSVNSLALDAKGGLWIATWPTGLDYLAPGANKFTHWRVDSAELPDAPINKVEVIAFDTRNRLWIGTRRGVYRWTSGSDWSERKRMPSPDGRINNFFPARDGGMWAATMTDGVLRWSADHEEPENYIYRPNDPYSLPTRSFQSVMQDRSGMLWAGSYNAGILVANPGTKGMTRIIPPELPEPRREPNNTTTSITAAPDGRLWLGGLTGITLLNPRTGGADAYHRAEAGKPGTLASDTIHSIYQQPGGPLWIGTFTGLNRHDKPGGPFSAITFAGTDNVIAAITSARDGKLWVGTNTSLIHYDPATGAHRIYKGAKGSGRDLQSGTILEDSHGRLWTASEYNDGLNLIDKASGAVQYFMHDDADARSLSSSLVSGLHEDARGRLWAGTAKGINEIIVNAAGKVSFRHFPAAGTEKVFAIQSDARGHLWFTTPSALIHLDPATGKARRYSAADGLIDGYRVNASVATSDGTLYFAGATGVIAIRPNEVQVESSVPLVAITDISVSGRSLAALPRPEGVLLEGSVIAPRALVLPPDQTSFSIEFAALHFANAGSNSFVYRLEGFDPDWIKADASHRAASYTNLDPGHYVFKVKAANNRGLWNEQAASLAVTVLPPYWKTWWFRILAAALAIAVLAMAYHARIRSLTNSKRRLETEVAARTGELSESNAKLAALSLTDALTGLTNRRGFDAALADAWARALRSGNPVSLAMIDVDHFKLYNDHYGHQAGDQCLRAVADVIAEHARRPGDTAARYGGEEFVLLATDTSAEATLAIARAICTRLTGLALDHARSPYHVVTVSIGVASLVPADGNSSDMLIRLADGALYQAKHEGRNRAGLAPATAEDLAVSK